MTLWNSVNLISEFAWTYSGPLTLLYLEKSTLWCPVQALRLLCGLPVSVYSLLYTSSYTVTSLTSCYLRLSFWLHAFHILSLYSIRCLSSSHCSIDKPSRPPGLIIFGHFHILCRVNAITQPPRPSRLLLYHFPVRRQVKTLVPSSLP